MPSPRSRNTFTPVELTRLLRRLEDVLSEATRLRQQVARRLLAQRGNRLPSARRPSPRPRP